jgi:hypothetical protein
VAAVTFSIVALVTLALAAYLGAGEIRMRARSLRRPFGGHRRPLPARTEAMVDPGAERRAERRARALLKSVVNREEWEMYRDLGFIRVTGSGPAGLHEYRYLIYPHRPIVAYLVGSNSLLSEYCVEFPDLNEPLNGSKLPDSDDVLAKWIVINADEERLLRDANLHLPGRQVDPQQVRRDLWRLSEWDRARRSGA